MSKTEPKFTRDKEHRLGLHYKNQDTAKDTAVFDQQQGNFNEA